MYYPKISIVTPCYNVKDTIEATLKSIHDQNYPNLEHIIMDGGSTDGTVDIINKYKDKLAVFISKKDNGQYFAINEGFSYATGEIYCWLNADDISLPWTFKTIANIFSENKNIQWLTGITAFINEKGMLKKIYNNASAKPQNAIKNGWFCKGGYGYLLQESMFWSSELWHKVNGLNTSYKLAGDFDLWIKYANITQLWTINIPLSCFRLHNQSRSITQEKVYLDEVGEIKRFLKPIPLLYRLFGNSQTINFLLRSIIFKKTMLIYQPYNSNKWIFGEKYRSLSGLTLSELLLEKDEKNIKWK